MSKSARVYFHLSSYGELSARKDSLESYPVSAKLRLDRRWLAGRRVIDAKDALAIDGLESLNLEGEGDELGAVCAGKRWASQDDGPTTTE